MWLINTKTYTLQNFVSAKETPPYAILSHCWEADEVTFTDMRNLSVASNKAGWSKIAHTCYLARLHYCFEWAWIDTCCIDKSSSAELSEAINSMFVWYARAALCLAFLADVPSCDAEHPADPHSAFRRSRWFRRGWTLQELIAPRTRMLFFARDWALLAARHELAQVITDVTGISPEFLAPGGEEGSSRVSPDRPARSFRAASIAQRFAWAAGRETTRAEDRAYSLMGLCGVNMPVLYGEGGAGAFRRLQLELLAQSADQTLFAWGARPAHSGDLAEKPDLPFTAPGVLLATSPDDFRDARDLEPVSWETLVARSGNVALRNREPHYQHTNRGVRVRLPIVPWSAAALPEGSEPLHLALLACE
ncbi:hypothetical protein BC628DRAFT_1290092, partial [Trametes gibbosa]